MMGLNRRILKLGNPLLKMPSMAVKDVGDTQIKAIRQDLENALHSLKSSTGYGRALAAPQLGYNLRMVAINIGRDIFTMHNPEITWRSDAMFSLWDECLSMPDLLVRVQRHQSISVSFMDEEGEAQSWEKLYWDHSELMQHELDHLNGILMLDRAMNAQNSIIYRSEYERQRGLYDKMVDYKQSTCMVDQPTAA